MNHKPTAAKLPPRFNQLPQPANKRHFETKPFKMHKGAWNVAENEVSRFANFQYVLRIIRTDSGKLELEYLRYGSFEPVTVFEAIEISQTPGKRGMRQFIEEHKEAIEASQIEAAKPRRKLLGKASE